MPPSTADDVLALVKASRFDEAIVSLEKFFPALDGLPPTERENAVEPFTRFTPIFGHARDFVAAAPFFERLAALTAAALGTGHPHVYRMKRTLAGVLAGTERLPEAVALQEEVYAFFKPRVPADHPGLMVVRDTLAIFYRNAGRPEAADALYADAGLCGHLRPLLVDLLAQGARVVSAGQPWSKNCHVWVYVDAVLDVDRLRTRLGLPEAVELFDHRGTVDGAERGLVCREHEDGVMGPHPDFAVHARRLG